ncbi:MAG: carbohydrate kinase [Candidatus Sulfotelmatobacter sp.]
MKHTIVGLGEILWDLFPAGPQLGGAPANFAYITSLLGSRGIAASRLGQDDLGREAMARLKELGVETTFLQEDPQHPTGTVRVEVDPNGQPCFEISQSVAWDFLEWTPQWRELAVQADGVCFGSLAQRSRQSRATVRDFLRATRPECLRVFDVNLRQNFFEVSVLHESMKMASIVKLNHEELPKIMRLLEKDEKFREHESEESSARHLLSLYQLRLVCVTRGNEGSLLVTSTDRSVHAGFRVKIADTVGAGDAFTAALVCEYLRGASLAQMSEAANRVGAWVASQSGATPAPGPEGIEQSLKQIC